MSLNAQLAAFKKEQATVASRNVAYSRPASSTPARTSTPQPTASNDTAKRTHGDAFSQGAAPAGRSEMLSQVNFARGRLKEKITETKSFDEIISFLSLPNDAKKSIPLIKEALKGDQYIEWIPATTTTKETFKYRPIHPVSNAEELKDYLAKRTSAQGILVKELKDGWPDCVATIDELEKERFVLVTRNKKDNSPKMVYPDSPLFHLKVDQDFKDYWLKTKVPTTDIEIRNELEKAGITPTSQVKENTKGNMKKGPRKRPNRRGGKTTNQHMAGILKDYSKR
ncbi:hypothetical protein M409DRAFT_50459 [Zasmidium cellare ATCC 36951]|uniref:Transcription initiation factor IIE subunit beta n=1 Tax=Zasmidium cellare ATCC 36951 TaxID=1080233 RepID=A0A6A6D2G8_ZASCE|nr:uncharacterized protein M409DRAFT_50459 [Zasmidium cellare ATCC 36951]KAF2171826.1 hypothetical protein M409DRAFT_50459 [Zasmidium cellare ATCC 36951]